MPKDPVILYVAAQLPKRSETFVTAEILALRALGRCVLVASVHPPERGLGDPRLEALANEAIPIYGMGAAKILGSALREAVGYPLATLRGAWLIARDIMSEPGAQGGTVCKVLWQWLAGLALAKHIRPKRVSHIHAHMAHVPSTIAMAAARHLRTPFSFTGHAADLFRDRCLLKAKLKSAVFVPCISVWHRGLFAGIQPRPHAHYPVIRCGVDTALFHPSKRDPKKRVLLAVGRLVPKKGFDILLHACAALKRSGCAIETVIGGDGPELASLLSLRKKLGLNTEVRFPGPLTHDQVRALLAEAEVFVLPCRVDAEGDQDGIPVALMEAMAAGVPCVSGDLPPIRELILHEHTGLLVPPGDVEALQTALLHLLSHEPARLKLAGNARKHVEREFSTATNIPRLLKQFEPHCVL